MTSVYMEKPQDKCGFSFPNTITDWEEAIPLGNRQTGCLIWGAPQELRFSLDRTDIWDKTKPAGTDSEAFCYEKLVELAKKGDVKKIRDIFDRPYNFPTPTKLPAGKILLKFRKGHNVISSLSIARAEATLKVQVAEGDRTLRCVCHATQEIGMLSLDAPKNSYEIVLCPPEFGKLEEQNDDATESREERREISQGNLRELKYESPRTGRKEYPGERSDSYLEWFIQPVVDGFSYGVAMLVSRVGDNMELFYKIGCSEDGEHWMERVQKQLLDCRECGYNGLLPSHLQWWSRYFDESSISLPDKALETMWYRVNYLFGSCSGKGYAPMPLQGVWMADNGQLPPWKGDYHHDLNTQFSYCHYLKANHMDAGCSFIDFLWNRQDAAKRFAEQFYGVKGLCLPSVMSIDGEALGGWPMYSLSPTNQIWLCRSFEQYYTYTGDTAFLRERAYPYFTGTAKCMMGLLETGADGKHYLPISSSPEIHDDEAEAFVTPNSNYDLALLHYLFQTLKKFAAVLELPEQIEWEEELGKLPNLAVNEAHVLMLSPTESLQESHRHLSNAMAVYPLGLMTYDTDREREIIDATILDFERLGTGMWVGFSYAWMAALYGVQKNGEGAASRLQIFWDSFCSSNGFHLNGDYKNRGFSTFHYKPFTMEASLCALDALQEMLFQMRDGVMELFPAIPGEWKKSKVCFSHLRGEHGVLVSAVLCEGKLHSLEIWSGNSQVISVAGWNEIASGGKEKIKKIELRQGQNVIVS